MYVAIVRRRGIIDVAGLLVAPELRAPSSALLRGGHCIVSRRHAVQQTASGASATGERARAKEATVRRYHYDSHHQLRQHMQIFLDAYNFAKRLKTLNGLTPFESVCKAWT